MIIIRAAKSKLLDLLTYGCNSRFVTIYYRHGNKERKSQLKSGGLGAAEGPQWGSGGNSPGGGQVVKPPEAEAF